MKTNNTPRLCAGPQVVQQTPTKFWNVASVSEDEGEIVLYGCLLYTSVLASPKNAQTAKIFFGPFRFARGLRRSFS